MNRRSTKDNHDIIDLASISTNSSVTDNRYVCKECLPISGEQLLLSYPQAQIKNQFAGPSFRCPSCSTIYDSSLVKIPRAARKVRSAIGSERDGLTDFIIETISEERSKGLEPGENEYEKYDPEPNEDEWIKGQGGTIIDSSIELTDSSGMNRTVVRSDSDYKSKNLSD